MVHQGGAMLGERAAAPTLGLIVCFYSITTGVAYFARKLTPLKSNTKINAAGYPVPRCSLSQLLGFDFELQVFYQPPSLLRDQLHLWHLHPIGNGSSEFLSSILWCMLNIKLEQSAKCCSKFCCCRICCCCCPCYCPCCCCYCCCYCCCSPS